MHFPSLLRHCTLLAGIPLCAQAADLSGDNIYATGNLDINGNTASFGTEGTNAGLNLNYTSGTPALIDFSATASNAQWAWSKNSTTRQMFLDGNNTLSLFNPYNTASPLVLNPAGDSGFRGNILQNTTQGSTIGVYMFRDGAASSTGSASFGLRYTDTTGGDPAATRISLVTAGSEALVVRVNGQVGIGTTTPTAKLEVAGDVKVTGTLAASSIAFPDGSILQSINNIGSNNSIEGVGGIVVGSYSTIADTGIAIGNGAFAWGGGVVAIGAGAYAERGAGVIAIGVGSYAGGPGAVAIGSGAFADGGVAIGADSRAAGSGATALGGAVIGTNEFYNNIYCTAMGASRIYSGEYATAMGASIANGSYTTAMGGSEANGNNSTAMGGSSSDGVFSTASGRSRAGGDYSTALGLSNAYGYGATAIGVMNVSRVNRDFSDSPQPEDDLFTIGNGDEQGPGHRSNALVVHRNGNLRIAGDVQSKGGFRTPPMGDISMGSFAEGVNPADPQAGLDAGLRYPSE